VKVFYKKLFILALPIAFQNLASTSLNLIDTLMIGQLGETYIGAVALANQVFFLLMLFLFGISSGASVFTAQYWGKKDLAGIHRSLGLALIPALTGAVLFTLAAQFLPGQILALFTTDKTVISLGIPYLRIISVSYICTAVSLIIQGVLRSTGHVKLPLKITLISLSLNALFNYLLIFGKFGFPEMGIEGAALATTGARFLEIFLLLYLSKRRNYPVIASRKKLFNFPKGFIRNFTYRVYPVILNEVGWSLGITMFTIVYARMGTPVLAAFNIMDTVSRLVFVLFIGTGNASGIVLGNIIGENRPEDARKYARGLLKISIIMGIGAGIIIYISAPWVPSMFKISEEVSRMVTTFMKILSVVVFVKVSNIHIIVGILRSGGDTHICMLLEIIPLWLIGIPLAFYTGLVLKLDPGLVYLVTMSEEVLKYILGLIRTLSGKWIHDVT